MNVVEDVFATAEDIAARHAQRKFLSGTCLAAKIRLRAAVYNAVMAERERCARAAESQYGNTDNLLSVPPQSSAARKIANLIRGAA